MCAASCALTGARLSAKAIQLHGVLASLPQHSLIRLRPPLRLLYLAHKSAASRSKLVAKIIYLLCQQHSLLLKTMHFRGDVRPKKGILSSVVQKSFASQQMVSKALHADSANHLAPIRILVLH